MTREKEAVELASIGTAVPIARLISGCDAPLVGAFAFLRFGIDLCKRYCSPRNLPNRRYRQIHPLGYLPTIDARSR